MSGLAMPRPKYGMLTALRRDGRPGKQMPLLCSVITFGSWEKCAVVLKGQEFIPQHVKLDFTDQPTIHNLSNEASPSVSLNDVPLGYQYPKPLKHGDVIKFSNGAKFRFDPVVPLVLDITKDDDEGSIGAASKAQTNNRSTKAVAATKHGNSPTEESNKEKERTESDNVAASHKHYSSPIQHKKRITSSSSSNTNAKQQEEHLSSPTCDVQTKTTSLQLSAGTCKVFCLIDPQQRLSSVLLTSKDPKQQQQQQQQAFLLKETGTTKEAFALSVPLFV